MARVFATGFERNGYRYDLSFEWDDEAFTEKDVAFDIRATRQSLERQGEPEGITVRVGVRPGEDGGELYVQVAGEDVFTMPLSEAFDEASVLDRIPAHVFGPDPFTGCIVRAGIGAAVAQLIECKNETAGIPWWRPRARALWGCLRAHIPDMCATATRRAIWCMLRGGF